MIQMGRKYVVVVQDFIIKTPKRRRNKLKL
jgi:hypothetical protein